MRTWWKRCCLGAGNVLARRHGSYCGMYIDRASYHMCPPQFVSAVTARWPNSVLQFEDFSTDHAQQLLDKYRDNGLVFNDGASSACLTEESHTVDRAVLV